MVSFGSFIPKQPPFTLAMIVVGNGKEVVHMYKEIGGRELLMRRVIREGGASVWEPRSVAFLPYPSRLPSTSIYGYS